MATTKYLKNLASNFYLCCNKGVTVRKGDQNMATKKEKRIIEVKTNKKEFNTFCKKLSKIGNLEKKIKVVSSETKTGLKAICNEDARFETDAWSLCVTQMPATVSLDTTKLKTCEPELYEKLMQNYSKVTEGYIKLGTPVKKSNVDLGIKL